MAIPKLTDAEKQAITDTIALNVTAIKGYQNVLALDSANPKKSYMLDGEAVTRNEWRTGIGQLLSSLIKENIELRKLLGGGPTVSAVWLGKTETESLDYEDRN